MAGRIKVPAIAPGRKQALIVRSDLGLKMGKIAALCCHAVQPAHHRSFYKATAERLEQTESRARYTEGVIVVRHLSPTATDTTTVLSLTGDGALVDKLVSDLRAL